MAKDKKKGSPEKRDKRENGRRAKTEQHRAALSSILAQVGSGPGITLTHRGGFFLGHGHSLQNAPFPQILQNTLSHFQ